MTVFSLPSNSPRYFVPATISEIEREIIRLRCIAIGTFPCAIARASHSTTAVFPTHGSPTRQGLFFVFLFRMEISRSISLSRPIIGSIFPARASSVRSCQKKSSVGVCESRFPSCGLLFAKGFFIMLFPEKKSFSSHFMISSIGAKIPSSDGYDFAIIEFRFTSCHSKSFGETPIKSRIW